MEKCTFRDVSVVWDSRILRMGNSAFSRSYSLESPLPHTLELRDGAGRLFAGENAAESDSEFFGFCSDIRFRAWKLLRLSAAVRENQPFESDHVLVTMRCFDEFSHAEFVREFFIYPEIPMFGLRSRLRTPVIPPGMLNSRPGLREDYRRFFIAEGQKPRPAAGPVVETCHPAPGFSPVLAVEFAGHTDVHDMPVREHRIGSGMADFCGNLLFCEDAGGAGLMILQEAPPSTERREYDPWDFRLTPEGDLLSLGWGVNPDEITPEETFVSYRNAVGVYHDGAERDALLKTYCRTRFNYGKERKGVVCNAWGCGNFPERLSPDFLAAEVKAAAECGADCYQIDDQWQPGSLQDFVLKNKDTDLREFWTVNPEKVGDSHFETLRKLAAECGIDLALWIAPSANKRFRDHREFAELILDFHRRYGFNLFKVDGSRFSSCRAERNFEELLKTVRTESGGKVFFNLDVTADMRGGYFKLLEYGNLFLENRYACHDWGLGYHPLRTLRNVWNLAKYVRLQYLQIEVPSPGDVNEGAYAARGESSPNTYSWDFWFAAAFMGNPLLWFAPSSLDPEKRAFAAGMLGLHKKYREEIFDSIISPVGDEPGAGALSGLAARRGGKAVFLTLFRGNEAEKASFPVDGEWEILSGRAVFSERCIRLPEKASYAVCRRKRG